MTLIPSVTHRTRKIGIHLPVETFSHHQERSETLTPLYVDRTIRTL